MKPSDPVDFRRLHPATLIQRWIVSIPGLILVAWPVFVTNDRSTVFYLVLLLVGAGIAFPIRIAQYWYYRYGLRADALVIESGIFNKRKREIDRSHIQHVDLRQTALQRVLGITRLQMVTAGSEEAEATLAYVSVAEGARLQALLEQPTAGHVPNTVAAAQDTPHLRDDRFTGRRSPSRKRLLQGAIFQFSLVYVGIAITLFQFWEPDVNRQVVFIEQLSNQAGGTIESSRSGWYNVFPLVIAPVLLGWLSGALLYLLQFVRFELEPHADRLVIRQGLITRQSMTVARKRIQALQLTSGPLLQWFDLLALRVRTAGFSVEHLRPRIIFPVATRREVARLVQELVGTLPRAPRNRVSPVHIRRSFIRLTLTLSSLGVTVAMLTEMPWYMIVVAPFIAAAWAISSYYRRYWSLGPKHLMVRQGVWGWTEWIVPLTHLQSVSIQRSFFQRRLGVATLSIDLAGQDGGDPVTMPDLPEETAQSIYTRLAQFVHTPISREADKVSGLS